MQTVANAGNCLKGLQDLPPDAMSLWQKAQRDFQEGRAGSALARYGSLTKQFSGIPQLWSEMGIAAAADLEFAIADEALQRALELSASDSAMLVTIGNQFYNLRRLDQAISCFEAAVVAEPSSVQMRLTLAWWLERYRRMDEALECIEICLAQQPEAGNVLYFKAFLLHRNGLNAEAETALRDLLKRASLPLEAQADLYHLLGLVLDELEQYAEAFRCLARAKALRSQTVNTSAFEAISANGNRSRRELLRQLTPEMLRGWREEAADVPCPHRLALVCGVMRSGTTLVEQILGAHPEVLAFDESMNSCKELLGPLQPPPTGQVTLESLNGLPVAARARLTARYFKSLLRETDENPGGKVFLDKNPSATAWLHVWFRLFPRSKVIVALRDPRDVVLSCYFQNIPRDWAIAGFSTLERTAGFYSDCMDVWLRMKELGGFEWLETRYEDVVQNLEGEGRRLTNFLGLPWHEQQATYYETAGCKFVHSPTYNEVTKPLYRRAIKRWEHYAEALAPA